MFPTRKAIFPASIQVTLKIPFIPSVFLLRIDARQAAESLILLASLFYISAKLFGLSISIPPHPYATTTLQLFHLAGLAGDSHGTGFQLFALIFSSFVYVIWVRTTSHPPDQPPTTPTERPMSPRHSDSRSGRTPVLARSGKEHFGYALMTVPKNYR
jgi:hypothetical protein